MDASSIATMTGKHNNELGKTTAGRTATEKWQQRDEENTSVLERGTKVPECIPELICVKQEPRDADVKEEMVLENEQFEESVLANRIKKRWHEFGIELPPPLSHDEGFVKHETLDQAVAPIVNVSATFEGESESCNKTTKAEQRPALCLSRKHLSEIIQKKMKSLPASVEYLNKYEKVKVETSDVCDKVPYTVVNPSFLKTKILDIIGSNKCDGNQIKDDSAENLVREILTTEIQLSQNSARSWSYEMLDKINNILESRSFRFKNISEEQKQANEKAEVLARLRERGYREARLARETPEAKECRLQSKRLDAALRRARETPEARQKRLSMLRLYRERQKASERGQLSKQYCYSL